MSDNTRGGLLSPLLWLTPPPPPPPSHSSRIQLRTQKMRQLSQLLEGEIAEESLARQLARKQNAPSVAGPEQQVGEAAAPPSEGAIADASGAGVGALAADADAEAEAATSGGDEADAGESDGSADGSGDLVEEGGEVGEEM